MLPSKREALSSNPSATKKKNNNKKKNSYVEILTPKVMELGAFER
jgi:hypothetical protein